jgi:hypothetical protein
VERDWLIYLIFWKELLISHLQQWFPEAHKHGGIERYLDEVTYLRDKPVFLPHKSMKYKRKDEWRDCSVEKL